MADINDGQQRSFRFGGSLTIGGDTVVQIGPNGGGLSWNHLTRRRLMATGINNGALQTPIEGEQQRGQFSLRLPYTGEFAEADSVLKQFIAASTDGLPVTADVVVTVYTNPGGTVGESFTFTGAFADDQGLRYGVATGDEGDMFDLTCYHSAGGPTVAAVTP